MEFDLHKLGLNEHDMLIDQLECRGLLTKKCGILTAFNGKQFHLEDAAGIHKTQDKEVGLQDTVDLNQFERPEAERPKNQSTDTQKCRLFNALEPIVLDRDLAAMVDDETYSADNAINVMHRQAQKNKTLESSNTSAPGSFRSLYSDLYYFRFAKDGLFASALEFTTALCNNKAMTGSKVSKTCDLCIIFKESALYCHSIVLNRFVNVNFKAFLSQLFDRYKHCPVVPLDFSQNFDEAAAWPVIRYFYKGKLECLDSERPTILNLLEKMVDPKKFPCGI